MARFPAIALLVLAAMLNWSLTCCCSESMFVEIARGGCMDHEDEDDHHQHGHAGSDHSGGEQHSCHKSWGSSFLPVSSNDGGLSELAAIVAVDLTPLSGFDRVQAEFTQGLAPGIPPLDIPLVTKSLLI